MPGRWVLAWEGKSRNAVGSLARQWRENASLAAQGYEFTSQRCSEGRVTFHRVMVRYTDRNTQEKDDGVRDESCGD